MTSKEHNNNNVNNEDNYMNTFINRYIEYIVEDVINEHKFMECIEWATKKTMPTFTKRIGKNISQQKKEAEKKEKDWGNFIINQKNNGQWTTLLGERLVRDVLQKIGENPRKPLKKSGFQPDWETDNFIYEVKTRNWSVSGTAGEKVLGTWIKYQNIPELYGKPLKIVCVGFQEYELTHGKVKYFGENISEKTKTILALAKKWNIEYIKFSDLVKTLTVKY